MAEVDSELRYVWIENPHWDFRPEEMIGKRDDELIPQQEAEELISLKREVFQNSKALTQILTFRGSDGLQYYALTAYPIRNSMGRVESILTIAFNTPLDMPEDTKTVA